jgi:hypothetical protein
LTEMAWKSNSKTPSCERFVAVSRTTVAVGRMS